MSRLLDRRIGIVLLFLSDLLKRLRRENPTGDFIGEGWHGTRRGDGTTIYWTSPCFVQTLIYLKLKCLGCFRSFWMSIEPLQTAITYCDLRNTAEFAFDALGLVDCNLSLTKRLSLSSCV